MYNNEQTNGTNPFLESTLNQIHKDIDNHKKLEIDEEFKTLIPPLSKEEFSQLEKNVLQDGIRDPIVTWNNVIIDGHNRYQIAQEHNLTFETKELTFDNRSDVIIWIFKNQLGRRNLPSYERVKLTLRFKPQIANLAKQNQLSTLKQNDNANSTEGGELSSDTVLQKSAKRTPIDTRAELAKIAGVSHDTISKVEAIEEKASDEVKKKLQSGEISINRAYNNIKQMQIETPANQESFVQEEHTEPQESAKHEEPSSEEQNTPNVNKPIIILGSAIGHIPEEPYHLLITSPPNDHEDLNNFVQSWLPNALEQVTNDGFAYIFIDNSPDVLKAYLNISNTDNIQLVQILTLSIKNEQEQKCDDLYTQNSKLCLFYRGREAGNLDFSEAKKRKVFQTADSLVEIAERFIKQSSKVKNTVFDPFAGKGDFLNVAIKNKRQCYGFSTEQNLDKNLFYIIKPNDNKFESVIED